MCYVHHVLSVLFSIVLGFPKASSYEAATIISLLSELLWGWCLVEEHVPAPFPGNLSTGVPCVPSGHKIVTPYDWKSNPDVDALRETANSF